LWVATRSGVPALREMICTLRVQTPLPDSVAMKE
jgi:hypothetical protein